MAFTRFTLAKQQPDGRCNALVRVNGIEGYCNTEANSKRCPVHDGSNVQKRRQEKAKQAIATSKTLREKTDWWMNDGDVWYAKSRFLSVDRHLLLLATLINELGNRKPLAGMTEQEIEHLAKLIRSYAELSLTRVETALKLWDKMSEQEMGTERFEDYVWLLILELGMVYDVDIKEMRRGREERKAQEAEAKRLIASNASATPVQAQSVSV